MKKISVNIPFWDKNIFIFGSVKDNILTHIEQNKGLYKPHLMNFLPQIVHPQSTCLDIGANIGIMTVLLSYLAYPGKIYSFEPENKKFAYLQVTLFNHYLKNIVLIKKGLYKTNNKIPLCDIEYNLGYADLKNNEHNPDDDIVVVRLDDWILDSKVKSIDFIKLNIDGLELYALQGGITTITTFKPNMIVEFNPKLIDLHGIMPVELYNLICSIYPKIFLILPDQIMQINSYDQLLTGMVQARGDLFCTFK